VRFDPAVALAVFLPLLEYAAIDANFGDMRAACGSRPAL